MGTSPITPCYDAERLETKTHVGLGPGPSFVFNFQQTDTEEKVSAINLLVFIVFIDVTLDVTKNE